MSSRFLIAAGLAGACATWGCSSNGSSAELLDYQSSGGLFGRGDGSELHVDGARNIERVNRGGETASFTLDAVRFDRLRDKIAAAQFARLAPNYGCGGCTDGYVDLLTVHLDGQTYDVAADTTAEVPAELVDLIAFLRDVIIEDHEPVLPVR